MGEVGHFGEVDRPQLANGTQGMRGVRDRTNLKGVETHCTGGEWGRGCQGVRVAPSGSPLDDNVFQGHAYRAREALVA